MKIAVIGNRKGWDYDKIEEVLLTEFSINEIDEIISGGAVGVDTFAQQFAKKYGLKLVIFYPDLSQISPRCFYIRNGKIAKECDVMVIFNLGNNPRSGSFNAMNQAKRLGKDVKVVDRR